jgi:hypothetical protein
VLPRVTPADRSSLFSDTREVAWCVLFRKDSDSPWRVWSERGSHHGASEDAAQARAEGKWGDVRIARKTTVIEWAWDD